MHSYQKILTKFNKDNIGEVLTLADIMPMSFVQLSNLANTRLTQCEMETLFTHAQQMRKKNTLLESRLLSRANPQLINSVNLDIRFLQEKRGYTEMFEQRADNFVASGSVSSMFSPAAYLTELYRETLPLHSELSAYNLKKRRSDLGQLLLSQENMDNEVSTLTLSNEILMNNIVNFNISSSEKVMETLSTYRHSGNMPYHSAYTAIRESTLKLDPGLSALSHSPYFSAHLLPPLLMALEITIPPELLAILTEEIRENFIDVIYEKNFGLLSIEYLSSVSNLAHFYHLSMDIIVKLKTLTFQYCQINHSSAVSAPIMDSFDKKFSLHLNKVIRLYKALDISVFEMESLLLHIDSSDIMNKNSLTELAYTIFLSRKYSIPLSSAQILYGMNIDTQISSLLSSQFDQLFNTPMLNGQIFKLGGQPIVVNLDKLELDDSFRRAVLKRAFQVDDTGLWVMHKMGNRLVTNSIDNTLNNLSDLYRIKLLAQVHGLTIDELNTLLQLSPYNKTNLYGLNKNTLKALIQYLFFITEWLAQQEWSVNQLFIMVTDCYGTVWSPVFDDLQRTLMNGLTTRSDLKEDELLAAMAPFIASSLRLNTSNMAELILCWANQIQPNKQTTDSFWVLMQKETLTNTERNDIIAFAQTLAQLSIIINTINISEQELSLLIYKPALLVNGMTVLGLNVDILQQLTLFHQWINGAGDYVNEILTALNDGVLTASLLANSLQSEIKLVEQAMAQVAMEGVFLAHWNDVFLVIQWIQISKILNINPDGLANLMAITYDSILTYAHWSSLGEMMLAALMGQHIDEVNDTLSEQLSAALSDYYIREVSPVVLENRNELYSYLLIDNQISAQVKTTRLAEAIASLQFYTHRVLTSQESGIDTAALTRQFFIDWDKYNARYNTWAAASKLVYYPENYVDPTMRLGQTEMMDSLLQNMSQSTLTSDVVESGVFNYLTAFEEIANLDVVSGYHNNIDINQGKSYFVSASQTEPKKFYWRSVDHSKSVQGSFAANAWSEWSIITCAISPWNMIIRPVQLNSRLFICWIERVEKMSNDGITTSFTYELKLSRMNYDGGWSSPFTYDVTAMISVISEKRNELGMFCSEYQNEGSLIIYFYKKEAHYTNAGPANTKGLYIYSDMTRHDINMQIPNESHHFDQIKNKTYFTLDTLDEKKLNNIYSEYIQIDYKVISEEANSDYDFIGMLSDISCKNTSSGEVLLRLNPIQQISYANKFSLTQREQAIINYYYEKYQGMELFSYINNGTPGAFIATVVNDIVTLYFWLDVSNGYSIGSIYVKRADLNYTITIKPDSIHQDGNIYFIKAEIPQDKLSASQLDLIKSIQVHISQGIGTFNCHLDEIKHTHSIAPFSSSDITFKTSTMDYPEYSTNASNNCEVIPSFTYDAPMRYLFLGINFDLTKDFQGKETVVLPCELSAVSTTGVRATTSLEIILNRIPVNVKDYISLHHAPNNARYMQQSVYRTRLNTLFSTQLISKASAGLDAILSMDTQLLPEPKLGEGTYITLELDAYDSVTHGESREFSINYVDVYANGDRFPLSSGLLSETNNTIVSFFVPTDDNQNTVYLQARYQKGDTNKIRLKLDKPTDPHSWKVDTSYNQGTFSGIISIYGLVKPTEAMDFNGANALYFWELFYYTPMMVYQRLLQESLYDLALGWLKYIWNPAGYVVHGEMQNYYWNCRPLEEDTSWNITPLDSVDPDALSQNDPMHYKVATFMSMLDLLIARGDAAYRQLGRDTLNEAKMWYMQAFNLLGEENYVPMNGKWEIVPLELAASATSQRSYQQALLTLSVAGTASPTDSAQTVLFLPEVNDKLQDYWQILAQRLYNLRHNLSIDGQPLSLLLYDTPISPKTLQSTAITASQGGADLPGVAMPVQRFSFMQENARSLVSQLIQFGSSVLNLIERQDSEALSELLQTQASDLSVTNIAMQDKTIAEIDADEKRLQTKRDGVQNRYAAYQALYNENINIGEQQSMDLFLSSSVIAASGKAFRVTAAAMDLVPNIYGLAVGGSIYGSMFNAMAIGTEIASAATRISGDRINYNENYRRRRQDWDIQRNNAENELSQIDAQLVSLGIRREAAVLQKSYLERQQAQTQAQLEYLQRKFSNKALYNWLRGCLSSIYYQFYDLTVSRCLMSQQAFRWEMNQPEASFIKPGGWNSTYAGLMAGENLMLNLAQMDDAYLKQGERPMEVLRTVSLAQLYASLSNNDRFVLEDEIAILISRGSGQSGTNENGLKMERDILTSSIKLSDLKIVGDYPDELGGERRIKQISVTLPMEMEDYQDVQAVLSYDGSVVMPRGCSTLAVSHGINDNGQFQLNFNDVNLLPFEGIPINDKGTLTLSFPNATSKQKTLLLSLSDIILHIRYTIRH